MFSPEVNMNYRVEEKQVHVREFQKRQSLVFFLHRLVCSSKGHLNPSTPPVPPSIIPVHPSIIPPHTGQPGMDKGRGRERDGEDEERVCGGRLVSGARRKEGERQAARERKGLKSRL